MRRIALLAALLASGPAMAETFDVPWYLANPAARQRDLRLCRDDQRLAMTGRCGNAELAETRAYNRQMQGMGALNHRQFWMDPTNRMMLEGACRPGAPASYTRRYCYLLGPGA